MPKKSKSTSSNENSNKKPKDKPTYKIIVLGCGGVGKVSFIPIWLMCFFLHDIPSDDDISMINIDIFVCHAEHVCSSVIDYLTGGSICSLKNDD